MPRDQVGRQARAVGPEEPYFSNGAPIADFVEGMLENIEYVIDAAGGLVVAIELRLCHLQLAPDFVRMIIVAVDYLFARIMREGRYLLLSFCPPPCVVL